MSFPCPRCGGDVTIGMFETISEVTLTALKKIDQRLEKIMSEDAAVAAVVADENTQITALTGAFTTLQTLIQALQAEVAAGTALQPATLASLQAAEAALDTVAQQAAADVAADQPTPPPAS